MQRPRAIPSSGVLHARLSAIAAALLIGCTGDDGGRTAAMPVDTAIVDLTIGAIEGTGPDVFGRLASVALDERGRIFAVDHQADEVRVFDESGGFLFTVGRTGAGPGELRSPCCIGFAPDGALWVRDNGNGRFQVFDITVDSAAYLRSVTMAHGDPNRWATVTFDADGRLIDMGLRSAGTGETRLYRLHLDTAGGIAREVAVHAAPDDSTGVHEVQFRRGDAIGTRYMYAPFGPRELLAHSPGGGYVYATSSHYALAWYDDDGALVRHTTGDAGTPPALSSAERERAEEAIVEDARFAGISRSAVPFGVPERKPPLRNLFFDAQGNLWVELNVAEGADRRAHVYDRSGVLVRSVMWPAGVDLTRGGIRNDVGVGIAQDSLGVQYVMRLRVGR
jgi:hypothetical protein